MRQIIFLTLAAIIFSACTHVKPANQILITPPSLTPTPTNQQLKPETMNQEATTSATSAVIKTSMGDIAIKFFPQTPQTVNNFVGLANGTKAWEDPKTGQSKNAPLYNNTIFHRVIPNFMIQGGDPLGNGTGGPGYKFQDETTPDLIFDRPYLLAMANSGPNTNGSQFFITVVATPWLNGKHTIFGEVTSGQDIVDKIANSPTSTNDKPITDILIKEITILY